MDLQTTPIVPNVAFTPVVKFNLTIVGGVMKNSLKIVYQSARKDGATWQDAGGIQKTLYISDLSQIPPELDSVKDDLQAVFAALSNFTDAVNQVKKVL